MWNRALCPAPLLAAGSGVLGEALASDGSHGVYFPQKTWGRVALGTPE